MGGSNSTPIIFNDMAGHIPKRDWNEAMYFLSTQITAKTDAYTLTSNDGVVICDGTFTITLPATVPSGPKKYFIKNVGSGTITVGALGTATAGQCMIVLSDGSDWIELLTV